uniref:RNA helicase n=1 Tax=Ditylenchus dipsaci TaxID=166011 RepID=A0A915DMV6_9BILA
MEMHRRNARHLYSMALVALRRSFYSSQSALCQQPPKIQNLQKNTTTEKWLNCGPGQLKQIGFKRWQQCLDFNNPWFPSRGAKKNNLEKTGETKVKIIKPEVVKELDRNVISSVLDKFFRSPNIRQKAAVHYLADTLYKTAFQKFRSYCMTHVLADNSKSVTNLANIFWGVQLEREVQLEVLDALFPHFLEHCQQEHVSSPSLVPRSQSYRKEIVFHAGPTNSGKTYEALEQFKKSSSGMYCAPLRLLAAEIFRKMNQSGVPCDLVTGEDRRFAIHRNEPASHLAITVEMLATDHTIDMAVIDEIQMVRDHRRGYAFTRALLGVVAPEIHVCGEEAAVEVVQKLLEPTGDSLEVRRYERKSPLVVSTHGLNGLENIQDGDCLVVFSKDSIISYAAKLRSEYGRECAIIYGDLPAATKLNQAARFNDANDSCKVLIATDAIGMGINLNIRRVIFSTLSKYETSSASEELLPPYFAKQIAGRAGRFGLRHSEGVTMSMDDENTDMLRQLMGQDIANIEKAGVCPPFEALEKFHFLLPDCSLTQLMDIFSSICTVSDHLFNCPPDDIYQLAKLIENIPVSLKDRHTFSLSPLKSDRPQLCSFFIKVVQRYSDGLVISYDYMYAALKHLMVVPRNLTGLQRLSDAYDCVGAYLWFSYRFPLYFPDMDKVRHLEGIIEEMFNEGLEIVTAQAITSPLHSNLSESAEPAS